MTGFKGQALTLALTGLLASACGGGTSAATSMNVTIPFHARVGSQPFACGQTYTGLGTTGTTYEPRDFRLYVHDVRLVSTEGTEVPVALTNDGAWQSDGLALLDFENKAGLCSNGTEETNDHLVGTVPVGHYAGLRFKVGVPFEMNHQDASVAHSPLNVSTLFWGWEGGYKFIRLDGRTTGQSGHNFHLGSTECQTSGPTQVTSCLHPNVVDVEIAGFDPAQSAVVVDVAALFADSNLDVNQEDSAPGCMSEQDDADCIPIFHRLGLGIGDTAADPTAQAFFRKE